MDASQGRIAVAVAMISVLGAVATGLLTNWDKIFGSGPAPQASANAAPVGQAPLSTASVPTANAPAAGATGQSSIQAGLAANERAATVADSAAANFAGSWTDNTTGFRYDIRQSGGQIEYDIYQAGMHSLRGGGRARGRQLVLHAPYNTCSGELEPGDQAFVLECENETVVRASR